MTDIPTLAACREAETAAWLALGEAVNGLTTTMAIAPEGSAAYRRACNRVRDAVAARVRGEEAAKDSALRDAVASILAVEEGGITEGCEVCYSVTFSYGDDANEIAFTGSDVLHCCRKFVEWYAALPPEGDHAK